MVKRIFLVTALASLLFAATTHAATIKVLKVGGPVSYSILARNDKLPLRAGQYLSASMVVYTGTGGYAYLKVSDGSTFKVGQKTVFKVKELVVSDSARDIKVEVPRGSIYSKVTKSKASSSKVTVKTPSRIAAIKGTEFGIEVDEKGLSKLLVTQGQVMFDDVPVVMGMMIAENEDGSLPAEPKKYKKGDLDNFMKTIPEAAAETPDTSGSDTGSSDTGDSTSPGGSVPTGSSGPDTPGGTSTDGTGSEPDKGGDETGEEKKGGGTEKQEGEFSLGRFHLGFGVDSVTFDEKTWTRIHLFPRIPIWKFDIALDFEVFLDETGAFSDKGWNFKSVDAGLETVFRKIYYISFSQKMNVLYGDEHVYLRVGALDGTKLGDPRLPGLIVNNYVNTLDYPAEKKLGAELVIGNISPLKIGVEGFVGDVLDFGRGGPVFGGRFFMTPLAMTKVPMLNKMQIGVSFVGDLNQYGGLKDSDGDTYPDVVDRFSGDENYAADTDRDGTPDETDLDADGDNIADYANLSATKKTNLNTLFEDTYGITNGVDFDIATRNVFSLSGKKDFFGILGVDAVIPLTSFMAFYGQFAMNVDIEETNDTTKAEGFGISAPGFLFSLGDVNKVGVLLTIEYRLRAPGFKSGYFDYMYDAQRAIADPADEENIITKDNYALTNTNWVNGVYGSLNANFYILNVYGAYEWLITTSPLEENMDNLDMSLEARASLSKEKWDEVFGDVAVLKDIWLEAFFFQKNITSFEDFFAKNPDMAMGFTASYKVGTTELLYDFYRTYSALGETEDTMTVTVESSF